jgi:DNA-binding MarR family transcriptional regulator
MRTEQTLGFWLKQTMQSVTNAYADALQIACASLGKPYAITPPQSFTLGLLLESEQDLPIGTLAQRLALDASVVTGIIRRLEQQGLVERVHDRIDYRLVRLHLTTEGRELARALEPVSATFNQRLLQGFSPEEQERLREQLARIRANALSMQEEPSRPDASPTSSH